MTADRRKEGRSSTVSIDKDDLRVRYSAARTGRIVCARLLPGTDLLDGIAKLCDENGIKYGYVPVCFGSLARAGYQYLVPNREAKIGAGYGEIKRLEGPVEFLAGTGVICQEGGRTSIHFHATLCDSEGKVVGGHMVARENPVLTTVDLVVEEVLGTRLIRKFDEETQLVQLSVEKE